MAPDLRTAGTCFGFSVDSEMPLRYLRNRGDGDALTIRLAPGPVAPPADRRSILEWEPPSAPLAARLYDTAGGYDLWVDSSGWFGIHLDERVIDVPDDDDPVRREERLWGIPSALSFAARGDVPLHAAAVQVGAAAVVIGAPGRFGKTTLAAAFAQAGHRVLSEDLACLRIGATPAVVPGPAMLRLRRDVAGRFSGGWGDPVGEDPDRVHIALDPATRGTCDPVRLAAVVLLRWTDGPARLAAVDGPAALSDLWALSFHLPTETGRARCFAGLADLLATVPVFNFWRPSGLNELPHVVDDIAALCLRADAGRGVPA
jgi:hypothetical protein